MAAVGTKERPVKNDSEIALGEAAAHTLWEMGEAVWFQGEVWELWGGGWRRVEKEEVERRVMEWMREVYWSEGEGARKGVEADKRKVEGTAWMMQRELAIPFQEAGVFIDGRGGELGWEREWCVAFTDKLVNISPTGEVRSVERPKGWFDTGVAPCEWGEGVSPCPTYEKCLEEWSGGDEKWVELVERACGVALTRYRGYQRFLLLEGAIRGGKGTILRLLKKAMGSDYAGVGLHGMSGQFGLQGLSRRRVLGCGEAVDLDGPGTQKITAVLKSTIGEDAVMVDRKHLEQQEVVMRGMAFICANGVPRLGNRGGGLSGKMLVLPFKRSFLGKENVELDKQLQGELAGVLQRWVKAAARLRVAPAGERWPVPTAAEGVLQEFKERSSVFSEFLHDRFTQNAEGYVEAGMVWDEWREWKRTEGCREEVSQKWLLRRLVDESDWGLGTKKSHGYRYLTGVSVKAVG